MGSPLHSEDTGPGDAGRAAELELVRRAGAGDTRAFATLVDAHRDRAWAVCLRITGHQYDAEDALQDALTAAWRHLPTFRGDARFGTWLHRIAANAALKLVTRRREAPVEEAPEVVDAGSDFALGIVERDALDAALALIPPDFRAALVLREYADMSYAEIAEAQGVGIQTVKSRLNRARRAVQTLLQDA
ncbi:RNA polymerase sigma factor [Pseudonocardia sulfidoxydans NBRC 16205]|uniref:RNA polymerase sigma factor n=1 Tax=Pseudonocardia sulfidoxydans NBRC 16205 TaxID=1223511 RepID=A0A511DPB1_9PSEU|nr:sigma-70 family RNA polymerase sigma factor [Pseudonocardia sulfidoxydans]GEL24888.1 RNA polymerase sigma factor [Pseudonocardia sulfidoxydans NBRC 16205]